MGQRCNLVVVGPSTYELYYSHWRANTLDSDLFWGPEHALDFVRRQRSAAEGADWLDTVWAEGGAVIDPARHSLLWWGGEDVLHDIDLRRLLLAWMARSWAGWEVRWAARGIVEQALSVGEPASRVLAPRPGPPAPHLGPPSEPDWVDAVLSVRHADGRLRFFRLAGDIDDRLWDCSRLVTLAEALGGDGTCDLGSLPDALSGGAHVEVARRAVTWWSATPEPWSDALGPANPGWAVEWVEDRYERHLELAGPALAFPEPRNLEARLRAILLRPDRDHADVVADTVARLGGKAVAVNPFASRDDCASAALRTDERPIPAGVGSGAPPPTPPPEDSPSPGCPLQSRDSVADATSSLNPLPLSAEERARRLEALSR